MGCGRKTSTHKHTHKLQQELKEKTYRPLFLTQDLRHP